MTMLKTRHELVQYIYVNHRSCMTFEFVAAQLLFACGGHLGEKAYTDLCSPSHTARRRINLWLQVSIWRC